MITRGIIIGKLIDDLSKLQGQIDFRCQLGLTDLNKFCEDFAREVLNIAYDLNLKNLNSERLNEPGIDLGDKKKRIAFQITSTATSEKINNTLEKITAGQLKEYEKIIVFIFGKKQTSYGAIKSELKEKCRFNELEDIWDIADLCRQSIVLKYDDLYMLYKLFEKEFQIVLTEIEVPNKEGKYPTTLSDKLEVIPNTRCENASKFLAEYEDATIEEVHTIFNQLGQLPRVTREFLGIIIELGDNNGENFVVSYNELKRKLRIPEREIREELSILIRRQLVKEPDEGEDELSTWFDELMFSLMDFAIRNECLTKVLVALDFTQLDEAN